MCRHLFCVALIVCINAFSYAAFGQDKSGTQIILSIKISEKTPEAARLKILAEPIIATTAGRAFSYESGGTVKPKTGEGDLEIGTCVTGKWERTGNGAVQLALKISIGATVSQEDDPNTDLVRTETVEIRTFIRPGTTKRFNCSANQWCEISVDDVN